jgi:hypothetical protein
VHKTARAKDCPVRFIVDAIEAGLGRADIERLDGADFYAFAPVSRRRHVAEREQQRREQQAAERMKLHAPIKG